MGRRKQETEQIQVNRRILEKFQRTCNILQLRWTKHINDLMQDFILKEEKSVNQYLKQIIKEPQNPTNIKSGRDMMYAIESFHLESENDALGSIFQWLRTDLNIPKEDKKRIKKTLSAMGLGLSRWGELYISIQNDFLVKLLGTRTYSREMKRCDEYRDTKTCNLSGTPRRCMVFDISGDEV